MHTFSKIVYQLKTDDHQKRDYGLVVLTLLLAFAIFIIDALLPMGYNASLAYLAGFIVFLWIQNPRHLFLYTILCTLLILVDSFISPVGGDISVGLFNKFFTTAGLWISAFVVRRHVLNEQARLKNEQQLNALYSAASEAILVTNGKGDIIMANPYSHQLFGYEDGDLIGRKIEDLVPIPNRENHEKYREEFVKNPRSRTMESGEDLYAQHKDGFTFPVEISLSYYRQNNEMFIISFVMDITQRKEAETALIKAKTNLEMLAGALKNSNNELEQFAYVASHDLQEPLRKIMAFGDRLKSKLNGQLAEDSRDYLNRMIDAAGRMKNLINDLLSFSRLTSQANPFTKVDLNTIATEVVSDLEVSIEKTAAKVQVEKLPVIEGDPLQMRQLLQNLISNALKFSNRESNPEIYIFCEALSATRVQLKVQDNGIGFDEKYLDRIFTIFQRLDVQSFEGSGVGLAICKKIARRHGGDITARSAPGKGATFIVDLPLSQAEIQKN